MRPPSAISSLGQLPTPAVGACGSVVVAGVRNPAQQRTTGHPRQCIAGLNKFLKCVTDRFERGKNRVDHIGHLNSSLMASNGLNATAESAKQIP
jgi:hypothetical protein